MVPHDFSHINEIYVYIYIYMYVYIYMYTHTYTLFFYISQSYAAISRGFGLLAWQTNNYPPVHDQKWCTKLPCEASIVYCLILVKIGTTCHDMSWFSRISPSILCGLVLQEQEDARRRLHGSSTLSTELRAADAEWILSIWPLVDGEWTAKQRCLWCENGTTPHFWKTEPNHLTIFRSEPQCVAGAPKLRCKNV